MAEQGTLHMGPDIYYAAMWETNNPNSVVANELYLYRTHGDSNVLHIAAQHGNPKFINRALADANPRHYYHLLCHGNSRGKTPLHLAAEFGSMVAVKALLHAHDNAPAAVQQFVHQRKPCWTEGDTKEDTPFHTALRNRHEDIAILLLDKDIHQLVSVSNGAGESPAYLAAEASCMRVLQAILNAHTNERPVSFSGPFGQTVFHSARRCNGEVLRRLINMRGDLSTQQDGKGKTILHYAVEENRLATVETLLINVDSSCGYMRDNDGFTPLLVASRNGLFPMIRTILKFCPQSVELRDNHGKTVLHVAKIGDDFLRHLLKNKIIKKLINEVDDDGNTPLHTALINSKYQAASDLLAVDGCNWKLKNNKGTNPLDLCKSSDTISYQEPVYSALRDLEGRQCPGMAEQGTRATRHMDTNLYNAALWETRIPDDVAANELYLYRTHGDRNNAIHIAAQHGNPKFIKKALASQADPEHRYRLLCQENSRGETPLHLAAEFGHKAAVEALLLAHVRAVPAAGVPNQSWKPCWSNKDTKGDTPLHRALRNGHEVIAKILLGKDNRLVTVCNVSGESPAYLATERSCSSALYEILRIEQQYGANFSAPSGLTIFHAARSDFPATMNLMVKFMFKFMNLMFKFMGSKSLSEGIMKNLIKMDGALLKEKCEKGRTAIHYIVEKNRLANVETLLREDSSLGYLQDNDGFTPLLVASSNGLFPMMKTILKWCPQSVEIRDNQGKTILHVAKTSDGFMRKCLTNKRIKELINQADNDGNTPLHTAVRNSDYQAALDLLADDGCNWRLKNNEGHSPLDVCKSNDTTPYQEVVYRELRDLEGGQRKSGWIGTRGIRFRVKVMEEEDVEELLNKISIAAAVLMTLTFQIALNVPRLPSGFNNSSDTSVNDGDQHQQIPFNYAAYTASAIAIISALGILILRTFGMYGNKKAMAMRSLVLLYVALGATVVLFLVTLYLILDYFLTLVIVSVILLIVCAGLVVKKIIDIYLDIFPH